MALQGEAAGAPVGVETGRRSNVGPIERAASVVAGGAIAAYGIRRQGIGGLVLAGLGGTLVYRGVSGRCPLYQRLGIGVGRRTPSPIETPAEPFSSTMAKHLVTVVTINRSPAELYQYWRNLANLPRFMKQLETVQVIDATRSHWVAKAPFGTTVEWDAEITSDEVNANIAWRSLVGSKLANAGEVRFIPAPDGRGTEVRVTLDYVPPGGKIAVNLARLFGEAPEQRVREDLRRFKQLMEAGEIPTTTGQPTCR